ncbi:transmembrane emp24 domain-containing protein 5-like [Watersipora subatra]|uniref:transmembrane emp24 domain-containing protein 5-like n=1 Tax=Watersipora subatra TaxID=2589382 RepID=UPI00355B15BD
MVTSHEAIMPSFPRFGSLLVTFCLVVKLTHGFGYDYTLMVPAGQKECYYQPITNRDTETEFEYQSLDQTPVNFQIRSPSNVYLVADIRKAHNVHPLHLKEVGIYEVCVVNRYSNTNKVVYLGLYSDAPDSTWPFRQYEEKAEMEEKLEQVETILEMSVEEIGKSIEGMTIQADKMRYLQQSIRTSNVKDFIVQRMNYSRVNTFSGVQLVIMVAASLVQVYTIRQLFTSNPAKDHNMKMAT